MLAPEAELRTASDRRAARLHCLLLCDLADSTALIERLGDARAAELIRQHDRIARDTLKRHHGREIDKTDGFLILFERPIDAVAFALDYQAGLARIVQASGFRLQSRVGIHVGEILSWRNADADIAGGAKPVEVEGLAKAIAARLMALADPGQILLSESAYSMALRARGELPVERQVKWKEHGRYRLHGVAAPLPVFEVGTADAALQAPRDKIKARRVLPWYRWKPVYALLLLALAAAPLWYLLRPAPAIAFVKRDWIVVGDLRNLTGDSRYEKGLDSAIRLGLDQSRHVNIVASASVRQTLALMRRDADTAVDREVGGELAQRTGARALLLPSLAMVGGRTRFSAELIEPSSGVTVFSASADAEDDEALLPAVDGVLRDVREILGEAPPAIDQTSAPLAKVTTPSLMALRAYAMAVQAKRASRYDEARALLAQALQLDPEFAMAHMLMAGIHFDTGRHHEADEAVGRALLKRERMTERERLNLDGFAAVIAGRGDESSWLALSRLYPDDYAAHEFQALLRFRERNQPAAALERLQPALAPRNPRFGNASYQEGLFNLALGELDAAVAAFRRAVESGVGGDLVEYAVALQASGDENGAAEILDAQQASGEPEIAMLGRFGSVLLALHAGNAVIARERAGQLADEAARLGQDPHGDFALLPWALDCLLSTELDGDDVAPMPLPAALQAGSATSEQQRVAARARALLAAALARRCGDSDATAILDDWLGRHHVDHASELERDLLALVDAETALAAGAPAAAAATIAPRLDGDELVLLRWGALRAALSSGNNDAEADAHARWLKQNRLRGYAEFGARLRLLTALSAADALRAATSVPTAR